MALNLADKKEIVAKVTETAKESISMVAADYRELKVGEMTELRAKARQEGIHLQVVRNTLAKRALKGTDFECMDKALVGPIVLAFSKSEPGGPAKLLKNFAKDHDKLEVKALSIGGEFYEASHLDAIASLPSRDEAFAQLAAMLQAPVTQLARTMVEAPTKLLRAVDALKVQKEEGQG